MAQRQNAPLMWGGRLFLFCVSGPPSCGASSRVFWGFCQATAAAACTHAPCRYASSLSIGRRPSPIPSPPSLFWPPHQEPRLCFAAAPPFTHHNTPPRKVLLIRSAQYVRACRRTGQPQDSAHIITQDTLSLPAAVHHTDTHTYSSNLSRHARSTQHTTTTTATATYIHTAGVYTTKGDGGTLCAKHITTAKGAPRSPFFSDSFSRQAAPLGNA